MPAELSQLDQLRREYQATVDNWITAIRHEEAIAALPHSIADMDAWEQAAIAEEDARNVAKAAKADYEDAAREIFSSSTTTV